MVLEFEIFILLLLFCYPWFPFPVFVLCVFTNFCSVFLFACIAGTMGLVLDLSRRGLLAFNFNFVSVA